MYFVFFFSPSEPSPDKENTPSISLPTDTESLPGIKLRLLLYRECERRGRKCLYDSNHVVLKELVEPQDGNSYSSSSSSQLVRKSIRPNKESIKELMEFSEFIFGSVPLASSTCSVNNVSNHKRFVKWTKRDGLSYKKNIQKAPVPSVCSEKNMQTSHDDSNQLNRVQSAPSSQFTTQPKHSQASNITLFDQKNKISGCSGEISCNYNDRTTSGRNSGSNSEKYVWSQVFTPRVATQTQSTCDSSNSVDSSSKSQAQKESYRRSSRTEKEQWLTSSSSFSSEGILIFFKFSVVNSIMETFHFIIHVI